MEEELSYFYFVLLCFPYKPGDTKFSLEIKLGSVVAMQELNISQESIQPRR